MSLIVGSILLLLLPWVVLPSPDPKPEVRGIFLILWWINRFYTSAWHRLVVENDCTLPKHGAAILVANHTCGIDHMILQAGARRILGFMVAQEFYDYWVYHPFCVAIGCIPVKRDGRDQTALRAALRALKAGRVVPIFPEGRINPSSGREFYEPKPGAAFIALRAGVPVVPVYIRGTPATDNIVKSLTTPSNARIVFGPPIDLSDLSQFHGHDEERTYLETASKRIMDAIKSLKTKSLEQSG